MKNIRDEIDRELSSVTFESIDKERIRLPQRKERHMKINKKVFAISAAAVVAAGFTVSVGAANDWNYGRVVSGFFPKAVVETTQSEEVPKTREEAIISESAAKKEVKPELIDETAQRLTGMMQQIPAENITSTFKNYDVTLDGLICDGKYVMVSASFRKKDGSPIEKIEDSYLDTFFDIECDGDTEVRMYRTGPRYMDDGSLQVLYTGKSEERITEKVNAKLTVSYLLIDGSLKKPQNIDEEPPETVLDDGVLTADIVLDPGCGSESFTLTGPDGDTVNAEITPISMEISFEPREANAKFEQWMHKLNSAFIYNNDGEELITPKDFSGGGGSETNGTVSIIFGRPVDISQITGVRCGLYTYGNAPELDPEEYPYVYY